jgi:hypothetical protein
MQACSRGRGADNGQFDNEQIAKSINAQMRHNRLFLCALML